MKRSQKLIKLSREHHAALVLARRAQTKAQNIDVITKLMADFPSRWNNELVPHFAEEECMLVPRLQAEGSSPLAERLLQDHDRLRLLSARIVSGESSVLPEFGKLLSGHVRFEERELFPYYEQLVDAH